MRDNRDHSGSEFNEAGIIRNVGWARIRFESIFPKISRKKNPYSEWLQKIDLSEFTTTILHKSVRFLPPRVEFDESIYWAILFLVRAEEEGEICVEKESLFESIREKNSSLKPGDSLQKLLSGYSSGFLTNQIPILEDLNCYYLVHLHKSEIELSENVFNLMNRPALKKKELNLQNSFLSEEQRTVVARSFEKTLTFISGGPGTGKTTIIEAIVREAISERIDPARIILTAPTGKAAKRLKESAAKLFQDYPDLQTPLTIHKLLGYSNSRKSYGRNQKNPLDVELLIIDESSMIDIFLAVALLNALPQSAEKNLRVIFVGDPDQLMSVNSGNIFSDFVNLKEFSLTLTKPFRITSKKEKITRLTESIRKNMSFDFKGLAVSEIKGELNEISLIETHSEGDEDLFNQVHSWRSIAENSGDTFQILSPFNEGWGSVAEINEYFHNRYLDSLDMNSQYFNEPVIVKRNLYDFDLYNGETGFLIQEKGEFFFCTDDSKVNQKIPKGLLNAFDKAYAITVHKSQGSEYDHICVVIPERKEMKRSILSKRILYTAITRCRKTLTIIGSVSAIEASLKNTESERKSNLIQRIRNLRAYP